MRVRLTTLLLAGVVSLLGGAVGSEAASIELEAIADAEAGYFHEWPAVNSQTWGNGSDVAMDAAQYNGSYRDYYYYPYIKFDLSSLADDVEIEGITLHLRSQYESYYKPVNVYRVTDDTWTESTLSYSNQPATGQLVGGTSDWAFDAVTLWADGSIVLEAAELAEDLADDVLSLRLINPTGSTATFQTRESGYAPYLTVSYIPEPATLSLLALGALALLRRKA